MASFLKVLALLASLVAAPAAAEDRVTLGLGRLFTNDAIGDGKDRWQTGSYALSLFRGPTWTGALPERAGAILEYRLRAALATAADIADPGAGDRRHAGTLSIGVHTHFAVSGFDMRVGGDLVGIGPATGLGRFQERVHGAFGLTLPDLSGQIGDRLRPTVSAEVARTLDLGIVRFRPFVEAQAGAEMFVRVGGDLLFGGLGRDGLLVRDVVTGQLYPGIRDRATDGLSIVFGADAAQVFASAYLPRGGTAELRDTRTRLRGGLDWNSGGTEVFYGVTWLSREFESQPEGQLVGSLRLSLRF